MTLQEKQELIDKKDWDSLVNTDILSDFNFRSSSFTQYVFDKSFILDFLANGERFNNSVNILKSRNILLYADDVCGNAMIRVNELNIVFSTSEWEQIVSNFLLTAGADVTYGQSAIANVVSLTGKDSNYAKVLLNDSIYALITNHFRVKMHYIGNEMSPKLIEGLTPQELKIIGPRLTFNNALKLTFSGCDHSILLKFVDDIAGADELGTKLNLSVGKIVKNAEIKEVIDYIVNAGENTRETIYKYFKINKDKHISDEEIDRLTDSVDKTRIFNAIVHNLDKEQIIKYKNNIPFMCLVERDDITLDEVVSIKKNSLTSTVLNTSLVYTRFFTEDEIRNNPRFFPPKLTMNVLRFYITKDTLKVLNKEHGTKVRYNNESTNFKTLVDRNTGLENFTLNNIKYLKSKTNTDNTVVFNALNGIGDGPLLRSDDKIKNMLIVNKLINKFS